MLWAHCQVKWTSKDRRIRCYGHILNLAAQAFLQVSDPSTIEESDESDTQYTLRDLEAWKKFGPIGKLHSFVVRTQRSTQRYQRFLVLSRGKHLARDNCTRWNSFERMISTALKPDVRSAIDRYINEYGSGEGDEVITLSDWEVLEKVRFLH